MYNVRTHADNSFLTHPALAAVTGGSVRLVGLSFQPCVRGRLLFHPGPLVQQSLEEFNSRLINIPMIYYTTNLFSAFDCEKASGAEHRTHCDCGTCI